MSYCIFLYVWLFLFPPVSSNFSLASNSLRNFFVKVSTSFSAATYSSVFISVLANSSFFLVAFSNSTSAFRSCSSNDIILLEVSEVSTFKASLMIPPNDLIEPFNPLTDELIFSKPSLKSVSSIFVSKFKYPSAISSPTKKDHYIPSSLFNSSFSFSSSFVYLAFRSTISLFFL